MGVLPIDWLKKYCISHDHTKGMRSLVCSLWLLVENLFLRNEGFKKYFYNTSWLMFEHGIRLFSSVVVGALVIRYLGPEKYGNLSFALSYLAIFSGLAKLGLDGIVVRELVLGVYKRDIILGTAFRLKFAGSFFVFVLLVASILFTENSVELRIYTIIISAGIFFQSFEVIDFSFQSQVQGKVIAVCKLIQLFISSAAKVFFVVKEYDLIWFVIITLFDSVSLSLALVIAQMSKYNIAFVRHFDKKLAKKFLEDGSPLILAVFATSLMFKLDQVMLKTMLGVKSVGVYAAAVKLAEVWYFIPTILTTSLYPAIIRSSQQSAELFDARLKRLYSLLIWISLFVAFIMTFASSKMVTFLYGPDYTESIDSLIILSWASVFIFIGNATKKWFLVKNMQSFLSKRIIGGVIINIVFNLFLIPRYHVMGAAVASLISYAFTYFFSCLLSKETRQLFVAVCVSLNPKCLFKGDL